MSELIHQYLVQNKNKIQVRYNVGIGRACRATSSKKNINIYNVYKTTYSASILTTVIDYLLLLDACTIFNLVFEDSLML